MTQPDAEPHWMIGDAPREHLAKIRKALESKDWQVLRQLVPVQQIWAFQRPMLAERGFHSLEILFEHARDLHLQIDRVQKSENDGEVAHLSCSCCLMWTDASTWEQNEFELDVHLGLGVGKGAGTVEYLGLTIVTPEELNFVQNDAKKGAAKPRPNTSESSASTLGGPAGGASSTAARLSGTGDHLGPGDHVGTGDHVMVYMPVLVPRDAARSLLHASERGDD